MCRLSLSLSLSAILLVTGSALAESLIPPPIPEIPPIIGEFYSSDQNGDRIDDELQVRLGADPKTDLAIAAVDLEEWVDVELIFKDQITQQQIDDFLGLSGQIDYIYQAVSYGWNGRIPLALVKALPAVMGDSLVHVQGSREIVAYMDHATQTGRVRPIWQSGFAGSVNGYDGDPNIVIGIIDTGVDANHPDLAGRKAYWKDFTDENLPNPVDYAQHGTAVAGVALGSGQAGGSGRGLLRYTTSPMGEPYNPVALGPCPIFLPQDSNAYSFAASATWTGPQGLLQLWEWPEGLTFSQALEGPEPGVLASVETGRIAKDVVGKDGYLYMPVLASASDANLVAPIIVSSVTNYPGATDGFNTFRGVAPACRWAGAKVMLSNGTKSLKELNWLKAAIDDFVAKRLDYNIKIINLSVGPEHGTAALSSEDLTAKINSAVSNGVMVIVAGGNNGEGPSGERGIVLGGQAASALTVVATNDRNAVTSYSSHGAYYATSLWTPQRGSEMLLAHKPDVAAPGGSDYYAGIIALDSGTSDGNGVPDREPNDYQCVKGTSLASPFVAGSAALVIDALEQQGVNWWSYSSSTLPMRVKTLLCATATETGVDRENGQFSPFQQGPARDPLHDFPAGKDPYEGYGIINPDAAIEAATLEHSWGPTSGTLGSGPRDRRAWARKVVLSLSDSTRNPTEITLTCPATGDFDLYLYSSPTSSGEPSIWRSSAAIGFGKSESISTGSGGIGILVVKRASGYGEFTLSGVYAMQYDYPRVFSGVPQRFTFLTPYQIRRQWAAFGVHSSTDHDISLRRKNSETPVVTSDDGGAGATDFVIANGPDHSYSVYYADVNGPASIPYSVESDSPVYNLLTGREFAGGIRVGEVLDMFEVNATSGRNYTLSLDNRSGDLDLGVYVFAPSRSYGSRLDNDGAANNAGLGQDEGLSFMATASGYYGIVVVNENGGAGDYSIQCWED